MPKTIKSCLVLLLIASLALLPLRAAFSLPVDSVNIEYCSDMAMMMDMSSSNMSVTDSNDSIPVNCCDQCDDIGCDNNVNTVSYFESETINTTNPASDTHYNFSKLNFQSRAFTPPFRPPLFRFI